jgi:hypothetical protein
MLRKITILVVASLVIIFLWNNGLQVAYAHVLTFATNLVLETTSTTTSIRLGQQDDELVFHVTTLVDGRKGSYPQKAQTLFLPVVMIFAWQVMLFFSLALKSALKSALINILIFLCFHMVFLVLLTYYYNSGIAKFFFHLMMETFYIVAIVLILKDSIKYPLIWKGGVVNADKR